MKLSELFTILNTRILNLNHKPTKTIISTNLNINDIFNNYEERIGSRIAGYYDIYVFGDDLRFKEAYNASFYFYSFQYPELKFQYLLLFLHHLFSSMLLPVLIFPKCLRLLH